MTRLEIIYEDDDIIVCYKPSGVATQTKRLGEQDMVSILRNYRAKKKENTYIGVVHRLDQPVEGVMVYAKNDKAAAGLSKQVANRNIGKHYYAICELCDLANINESALLTHYMTFDARTNVGRIVEGEALKEQLQKDKNLKKAELEYRLVEKKDNLACIDIELHTGRHHQIRLQFAYENAPLLGDKKYGASSNAKSDVAKNVNKIQLALCSYKLEFEHPSTKKKLVYEIKPHNKLFADNFEFFNK